jgi:hypothetical protein
VSTLPTKSNKKLWRGRGGGGGGGGNILSIKIIFLKCFI